MAGGCFGKCHSPLRKKDLGSYSVVSLVSSPENKTQEIFLNIIFGQMKETNEGDEMAGSVNKGIKVDVIYLPLVRLLIQSPRESFHPIWKGMAHVHGKLAGLPASKSSKSKGCQLLAMLLSVDLGTGIA